MTVGGGPAAAVARPVAVVTGAGRGIGAATAQALARDGWDLVLVDSCAVDPALGYRGATRAELDAVARGCPGALVVVGDVRDQAALDGAVAGALDRWGRLDAAVAAAGAIVGGAPAWETGDGAWDAMLGINLTGAWRLARAAVPALLDQPVPRSGRFVAVASAAAARGLPQLSAYVAAKHGLVGLVRAMAVELGASGVTANAVSPGSTRTAMLDASASVYGTTDVEEFVQHQPVGRLLDPEEVADAIAWLCSPSASGVTGAVVPVDGGMTAG